jgi:hypothetical protein
MIKTAWTGAAWGLFERWYRKKESLSSRALSIRDWRRYSTSDSVTVRVGSDKKSTAIVVL